MKLIIVGVGNVGETLVKNLEEEGHDVTVVDFNLEVVNEKVNKFDVQGFVGGCLQRDVLIDAGVETADFFIACTSHDEVNILSCVLAKKLGAKFTVARVRQPEYFLEMESLRENLGLDLAFNPEKRAAFDILEVLKFPSAKRVELFADGRANMIQCEIKKGNPIIGKSLMEIGKEYGHVLFATIERNGTSVIPRGDFIVEENDDIHIIGSECELVKFCKKTNIFKRPAKSVFIIGGSNIAYYLAKELIASGVSVKILEKNKQRANELATSLPKATVLVGDGTDQTALDEEGVDKCDACVALMDIDEQNVMVSLYLKQKGDYKVIAKIDRNSMLDMINKLGLESVVSPRISIANHIVRFVRSNGRALASGGVKMLYKINQNTEALEFVIDESFPKIGEELKTLGIKRDVLVAGIVRGEEFILPTGNAVLEKDDKIIIVTTSKKIKEISEILS